MTLMHDFPTYVNVDCLSGYVPHHADSMTEQVGPSFQI